MSSMKPVRGTHDLFAEDYRKHQWIIETAKRVATYYGCHGIETPIFEFSSVFHRTLGESSDIVNKETYSFEDRGGEELTLRPEGTAPIVRAFISNGLSQNTPLKLFYAGPMFRYERPQKGRTRQFNQIGVEFLGVPSPIGDIEIITMAHQIIHELGLKDAVALELNSIGQIDSRKKYRNALVEYLSGYADELSEDSRRRMELNPLRILDSKDKNDQKIVKAAPVLSDYLSTEDKDKFALICQQLDNLKISYKVNPQLVRGLDYYNNTVFEFKCAGLGAQDTVLAGGRYDSLVSQMGGPQTECVGFAAGIERLAIVSQNLPPAPRPIAIVPLGEAADVEAVSLCQNLRLSGLNIEMSYSGNMSKRMKKANNMNARAAVIIGDDELKSGEATVKDLDSGAQVKMKISSLAKDLLKFV